MTQKRDYVVMVDGGIAWGPDLVAEERRSWPAVGVWGQRCKSGYKWEGERTKRIGRVLGVTVSVTRRTAKTCGQVVGRGELMCEDCKALLDASIAAERRREVEERMVRSLRVYADAVGVL